MRYNLFLGQSVLVTVDVSRKFLRILEIFTDTWIPIKEQVRWQSVCLSHYLRSLRDVWLPEHSYCINKVTTFHEVLMGLWSNEGNYLGYFVVDLFHRVRLCFSHYFLRSDGFHSRSLTIFRITGHLASFIIYNESSLGKEPNLIISFIIIIYL